MDADPEEPIVKKSDLLTGPLFKDNQNLLQDPEKPRNSVKKQQTKLFNKPKSNSKSFQEQVRDSNSLPGIQEFDEFPYFGNTNANMNVEEVVPVTAGSRPFLYRTRFQPQIQRNFRRGELNIHSVEISELFRKNFREITRFHELFPQELRKSKILTVWKNKKFTAT